MLRDETHGILYLHRELSGKKVPNMRGKLPWLLNVNDRFEPNLGMVQRYSRRSGVRD